jgi:hypothetical protein
VGVVLKSSKEKGIAECFMDFMKSPEITAIMKEYGFELADTSVLADKSPMQKSCVCCGKRKALTK